MLVVGAIGGGAVGRGAHAGFRWQLRAAACLLYVRKKETEQIEEKEREKRERNKRTKQSWGNFQT
jgi:hypothetical protein